MILFFQMLWPYPFTEFKPHRLIVLSNVQYEPVHLSSSLLKNLEYLQALYVLHSYFLIEYRPERLNDFLNRSSIN